MLAKSSKLSKNKMRYKGLLHVTDEIKLEWKCIYIFEYHHKFVHS